MCVRCIFTHKGSITNFYKKVFPYHKKKKDWISCFVSESQRVGVGDSKGMETVCWKRMISPIPKGLARKRINGGVAKFN
jgi:hypothetical protein